MKFAVSTERKLCVVLQHAWKGRRCALPFHPSRGWFWAWEQGPFHHAKPSKRIAVQSKPQVCLLYTREQRDALLRPLAGLGEFPLHQHRTMHEHMDVQSPFREEQNKNLVLRKLSTSYFLAPNMLRVVLI